MNTNLSRIALIVPMLIAAATTSSADTKWSRVAPEGAGFSIEAPGEPLPNQERGDYSYMHERWFLAVNVDSVEPVIGELVASGNRKAVKTSLEAMKDVMIASMKATGGRSSSGEVDGSQYLRFTFETAEFDCITQIVVTADHMYVLAAVGPKGLPDDNAKRFLRSFRLTTAAAGRTASSPAGQ